jgi:hypothetical protein
MALVSFARAGVDEFTWKLPAGFPEPAVPADNPMSVAKVALGEALFSDPRLSITGKYSCQSCHSPERAFTDGLPRSRGATGEALPLNAPTLFNVAYNASLGWHDPNLRTLEQQMRGPLFNDHPRELGLAGRERELERTLTADAALARSFAAAFPGDAAPVSMDNRDSRRCSLRTHPAVRRRALRPLRFRRRSRCAQRTAKRPACNCSSRSVPAAPAVTAASISTASGWTANIPRQADICRHGHRGGGARAHAAQPPRDRALHA